MSGLRLGYAIGSGEPVDIPLRHLVVTGQTQEAGKTTTLEALIKRSGMKAIAFVTKRGEGSFENARSIQPYFREQADWQFVASILEASRGEKLKFERAWIIRASRGAHTLADVQRNVRKAMEAAKGMSADVYLTLDAYLDAVVPQISRVQWALSVDLAQGLSVMDLTALNVEMQHLVIRSTLDWVLNHETDSVVVVPEAWKFIPQGRGTPVKLAAEAFIRQAAGLRNYLWLDSQDIAGVEKIILKSVPVWILGVQRESNEIKRTLAQIPAGIKKPTQEAIATLGLGEFFACYGTHTTKVYVQPEWMSDADATAIAQGKRPTSTAPLRTPKPLPKPTINRESNVTESEARELRAENERLRHRLAQLESAATQSGVSVSLASEEESLYQTFKARLASEAPAILKLLVEKPELTVEVTRVELTADGSTLRGRIARLIASGWFDDGKTQGATRSELQRTGPGTNSGNISTAFSAFVKDGFLTAEAGNVYRSVRGMKINIVER